MSEQLALKAYIKCILTGIVYCLCCRQKLLMLFITCSVHIMLFPFVLVANRKIGCSKRIAVNSCKYQDYMNARRFQFNDDSSSVGRTESDAGDGDLGREVNRGHVPALTRSQVIASPHQWKPK